MKNRTYSFVALTLVSLFIAQIAVAAQARWEEIVRAAEKEGEVTVYATNSVGDLQVIWDAFKKKFPKIKVTLVAGRGPDLSQRIMSERRAEKFAVEARRWSGWPGAAKGGDGNGRIVDELRNGVRE